MGFCPDLPLDRPFCTGAGLKQTRGPGGKGLLLRPVTTLTEPWIAFQGTIDQVCDADAVRTFVREVPKGDLVLLPKVGHGFSVQRNWLPQFRAAFARLATPSPPPAPTATALKDLPLVEVAARGNGDDTLAVIVSGDGGWASIDREVGSALAARGIPVVGLNALDYFWTPRTPAGMAADLARIIAHYRTAWGKDRVRLIGYSLGADVLPFMARGLPPELLSKVAQVVLLNPGRRASFEFHLSDWLGGSDRDGVPIAPELEQIQGPELICIYGEDEGDSLCREPGLGGRVRIVPLAGGHHFGGDYDQLAALILGKPARAAH